MAKSKWFCIAVEGATATDNRVITAQMLTEMAANYNQKTYGARVNIEHVKGYSPNGDFKAYGDVLALETRPVELEIGGKKQKLTGLYAQIEPTDDLVTITNAKQKIYTSMEVQLDFAKTGKFGLIGLAATDNPASLGTDILKFSAKTDDPAAAAVKAMFDGRKSSPDAFFSAAFETSFELEDAPASDTEGKVLQVFAAIGDKIFAAMGGKPAAPLKPSNENEAGQVDFSAAAAALKDGLAEIGKAVEDVGRASKADFARLQGELSTLKTQLENEPRKGFSQRAPATGGDSRIKTDC